MAWALQFDGVNDYALLDSAISSTGDFKFIFTNFKFLSDPTAINFNSILGSNSDNSSYFMSRNDGGNSDWQFKAGISTNTDYSLVPINQNRTTLIIERVGAILHVTFDGVTNSTSCSTTNFLFESISGQAGVFFGNFDFEILEYYNSSDTLVNKWDATASSHAAGVPILTDTIGGNDATGVNMPTDGSAWVDLGGSGISITVAEEGPAFTESINTSLSVNITGSIAENGPAFTESVSATLTSLALQASIAESGPSFIESITATLTETLTINADIAEQGPSFTESITANLGVNITSAITELGPSFTESININVIGDRIASIVESGPSFVESIIASIPITITVNPKNIIRVKRKDNTVIIKRKSNIIRVR